MNAPKLRLGGMSIGLLLAAMLAGGCPGPSDVLDESGTRPPGDPVVPVSSPERGAPTQTGGSNETGGAGAPMLPPQSPTQPAPAMPPPTIADAGADLTVEDGDAVTLAGKGNAGGSTVTFRWQQLSGPNVALSNVDSASAAFVAPDFSAELQFSLTVTSSTGLASDVMAVRVAAAPILFVANNAGNSVVSFRKPLAARGDTQPRATISGASTQLSSPSGLVFDRAGGLIVANEGTSRLAGWFKGLERAGDALPERLVTNPDALLNSPQGLAYDAANDLLMVPNFDGIPGAVNVFAGASQGLFSGRVPPARRIQSYDLRNPRAARLTADGSLYVADAGSQYVAVFADAARLDGLTRATRIIICTDIDAISDIAIDDQNHLLVVNGVGGRVLVFDNASSLNGEVRPSASITVQSAQALSGIALDAAAAGYLTDYVNNAVYAIRDIAGRSGTVAPDGVIQGPSSGLSGPRHLAIVQR
ncbi:MAG: hypothetical protein U1D55_08425 [Phycisphaerae bacterium]